MTPNRAARLCLIATLPAGGSALPGAAQSLDGTWRGTTTGTPSAGNCRAFTFDIAIRGEAVTGSAKTPHAGSPVQWKITGIATGPRLVLRAESADRRLRNPSTRRRGELRSGSLHLEQTSSKACNPTRSGALKRG